jgi:hypothetical protein
MLRVILCGLLLAPLGCSLTQKRSQTAVRAHAQEDISANFDQARLRMRAMVLPMSGVVVTSADQIIAGASDRKIRREALVWKIEAVPALREALFHPDPMRALGDAWILTFQMTDYFDKGPGVQALGEARHIAIAASQYLEAEVARVAASMTFSRNVSDAREHARKWAAAHPIKGSIAGRESLLSNITEEEVDNDFTPTEAVGSLVVTADDLNRRLGIYSAQFLDQARWQAELFAMDQVREYQLDKAMPLAEQAVKTAAQAGDNFARIVPALERSVSTLEKAMPLAESAVKSAGRAVDALDRTIPAVERSLAVVEKTPALVTAEREATIKALSTQVTRTTAFLQEERVATLKQITDERTATVRELGEALVQERKILTRDIEGIALKAVDHAFLRAAELCGVLLVAVFVGLVLLLMFARRVFFGSFGAGNQRRSDIALGQSP